MRKSNSYVHLSFDLVEEFVPRIPKSRLEKEDAVTPRICVAKYISQALSALPAAGKTIEAMLEIGMPVIIHAYYLQSDAVIQTEDLLEAVRMPDTQERCGSQKDLRKYGGWTMNYAIFFCITQKICMGKKL